jgi:hypothetical protein
MAAIVGRQANEPALPDLLKPLRGASKILDADPPPSAQDLATATDEVRKGLTAVEAKSVEAPADDLRSLYLSKALVYAWYVMGKAAFESKDLSTAENYLRAAWNLGQDRISGYQLGRVFEARGNKLAAAHQYELADITSASDPFLSFLVSTPGVNDEIGESYKRVTGKGLTATALKNGQYDGSLRAELDKEVEIHELVHTTKLNGQALFSVAFEAGKPVKAYMIGGDKELAALVPALQAHSYPSVLPTGSKARVLREFRLICTPYAGCDAYILLPSSIQTPSINFRRVVTPANAPKDSKTIEIEVAPPPQ